MRGTVVRGIGLIVLAASAGCSVFQSHELRIDAAAGMYETAALDYRVDGGQLSEPLTVARIAGQQVTHQRLPSTPHPDCSVARLTIRYPHPAGKKGYALAKLFVETRTPVDPAAQAKKAVWEQWGDAIVTTARDIVPGMKASDDLFETWSLDISKADLDRAIAGMMQSGYFVNPSKTSIGVKLTAQVDKFEAVKSWTHEPELDILMERVRRQGLLLSYEHPLEAAGPMAAVAGGNDGKGAMLVSHNEEGPALVPAGPQSNAYQYPAEPAAPSVSPRYTPPAPSTVQPSPPYTPPRIGPNAPPRTGAQQMRPRQPQRTPNDQQPLTSPGGQSPPQRQPAAGATRNRNNPAARQPYPPQNRRRQAPPAASRNAASPNAAPKGGTNPADASRAGQPKLRWPWRKSNASANGQPGAPTAPNGSPQGPRRPLLPGYGRQPAPASGGPSYYGRPGRNSASPSGGYPGYPQAAAPADSSSSGGYPSGMPQPPQITSRPSGY